MRQASTRHEREGSGHVTSRATGYNKYRRLEEHIRKYFLKGYSYRTILIYLGYRALWSIYELQN